MTWVCKKSLVIFLSLEYVDQISALDRYTGYIEYLILSLFLMIWWIWNLELLLISLVIDLHEPKFREAVLEANSIQPDTSHLDPNRTLSRSPRINALE